MRNFGFGLVLGLVVVGCSKSQPAPAEAAHSSQAPSAGEPAPASPPPTATPSAGSAAAAEAPSPPGVPASSAPASFKGGSKETIGPAVGLGCEATSLNGWLQLLCRKKNGTGGHPVRAVVHGGEVAAQGAQEPGSEPADAEAPAGDELTPNEQGELSIVVPFSGSEQRDVSIEWSDTSYTLHVTGPKATLEWAGSGIPHRRACQQLLEESKAALAAAQKAEGDARLTTTEASKLPRFGVCQPAGLGSWALALKAVSGSAEGAARKHHFELEVVRVDVDGARKSSSFGAVDSAPGGFELAALQVYDYDDDGRDELIVPYELKASPAAPSAYPAAIWTFNDAGVAPYAKAPSFNGGLGIEQLDFDMRPDFGTYGSFVAFRGPDCGLKICPTRLTGPKLFWHSVADGSFTDHDDATRSALKRASCQSKPTSVVVEAGGGVNASQTAKNLVCAKAYGVSQAELSAELNAKRAALCAGASACPLLSTLESWLERPLPVELSQLSTKKK